MIFNKLHKGSLGQRETGHLPGLSSTGHRQASPHLTEHARTPKLEDEFTPRETKVFGREDFIFLSDNAKCWMVRASDIMSLQACGNYTRVNLSGVSTLIRRPLRECECRLDPSAFFRTRRDCVVNLQQVKQMRMLDAKRLLCVLLDGREVAMSRKQSLLFKKQKSL